MNVFSVTPKPAIPLNAVRIITALAIGIILAIVTIEATFLLITTRLPTEGWTVHYDLGRVTKPLRRALVAKVGLGALGDLGALGALVKKVVLWCTFSPLLVRVTRLRL